VKGYFGGPISPSTATALMAFLKFCESIGENKAGQGRTGQHTSFVFSGCCLMLYLHLSSSFFVGTNFLSAAVFALSIRNFPNSDERGTVVGLVKGGVGLAGAVVTQIYTGFIGIPDDSPRTLDFILAISVFVGKTCVKPI
jgi:hypothetical protein